MATQERTREEAAALYAEKVRELQPDRVVEARLAEYRKEADRPTPR